jgi:hypothetical protein
MGTIATSTILATAEQAHAKKGEANDHISDQGREHMSTNGAAHSGVSQELPPPCPVRACA